MKGNIDEIKAPTLVSNQLNRTQAAQYLNISIDKFLNLEIDYYVHGPRSWRWDIKDIDVYMKSIKTSYSISTPVNRKSKQIQEYEKCAYTKETTRKTGRQRGQVPMDTDVAKLLELQIKNKLRH